jgi:hypothetical protein
VPCNLLISDLKVRIVFHHIPSALRVSQSLESELTQCNVMQTFTLPATLCGPVVLTAADNCYKCLAAVGFSVNLLQQQIDCTCCCASYGITIST